MTGRKLRHERTAIFEGWVKYRHMFSITKDSVATFFYVYTVSLDHLSSIGRYTMQRDEESTD